MNSRTSQFDTNLNVQPVIDYWQLFQSLPEAYMVIDVSTPEYRIVEVNRTRETLMGVSRENSVGKPMFEAFPDMTPKFAETGVNEARSHIEEVIRTKKAKRFEAFRYDTRDDSGAVLVRYWQITYVPLFDANGQLTHMLSAARDVTDEVRATRRVASVEDRLEAALAVGKVGSWLWDVDADVIRADKNLTKLFRLTKERLIAGLTLHDFLHATHPEDRRRVERAIQRAVSKRVPFEEEYRIVLMDGTERWVLARGKVEEQDGRLLLPGVIVDVTERRDLQAQVELARRQDQLNRRAARILQKRNEELVAIGRSKDEFVALASHQLRTPATAVKQYLGMVLQGYAGDITEEQQDMLDKAFESNERQIQIINQILNAARADTGKLVMTPIPLDMRGIIGGVSADMQPAFDQRHHKYSLDTPKNPVYVMADQGYLRMALENILYNACIYTPDGGTITAKLAKQGNRAVLMVTDTGVGIRKADLSKLFAKFSRIHNPLSVQAGGSGIGLYLAAEIVRLHEGRISVESKLHKGTTFAISLPLMQNTKQNRA